MACLTKRLTVACTTLLLVISVTVTTADTEKEGDREGKFFNLFSIVSFKNDACNSSSDEMGTCYTKKECSRIEGTASGECAAGFGVCCITTGVCGGSTSYNNTYFTNPGYSSTYSENGMCEFTVNKCADNVCQLRLEFEDFETEGPSTTGDTIGGCDVDSFGVTGGDSNSAHGPICGTNTGQHMIVHAGSGSTCILRHVLGTGNNLNRKWKIKIIQIPCNSRTLAPPGCNQYYVGHTGTIKSFNYESGTNIHLANQNQAACIRPEQGFCRIDYQETVATESFSVSTAAADTALSLANCVAQVVAAAGDADYILIPDSYGTENAQETDRFCGEGFAAALAADVATASAKQPVSSELRPFTFTFISDSTDPAVADDMGNYGFSIDYEQAPCEVF